MRLASSTDATGSASTVRFWRCQSRTTSEPTTRFCWRRMRTSASSTSDQTMTPCSRSTRMPEFVRWSFASYAAGAAYPEGWIRIEERPGARLVANLPPLRKDEAQAIVDWHNALERSEHTAAVIQLAKNEYEKE